MQSPTTADATATVLATPDGIAFYRLCTLRAALSLECIGMKHSQGSVYALVKREFGFKGTKLAVLAQLRAHIEDVRNALWIPGEPRRFVAALATLEEDEETLSTLVAWVKIASSVAFVLDTPSIKE